MTRNKKQLLVVASMVAVVIVASSCDVGLPWVDCSGFDQPDMGGLLCLGANMFALSAGVIAIIVALLIALGGGIPV